VWLVQFVSHLGPRASALRHRTAVKKITTFEDLKVFQFAVELMVEVYRITETYPKRELYGLVSQMQRASVSVVSHIGEGQGRLTFGEWRQMLSHGRGSLFELEAQTIASLKLGYIDEPTHQRMRAKIRDTGCLFTGLIRYVQRKEAQVKSLRKSPSNPQPATRN
jgi:four helix bundle protein